MSNIFEGILIKDGGEIPYHVRMLTLDHLPKILDVQEEVVQTLRDKNILSPLSKAEFQYILEGKGMILGAFAADKLIAFRALLVPPIDDEHLGRDIGLAEEELPKVIYQEISNVLPAYRGNQLQKTLALLIMQELEKNNHGYRYVCCTVAPFNIPSLKDKFVQGMRIAALEEKYGKGYRYIFVKDLGEKAEAEWKEIASIPMDDIPAQRIKLAEGWQGIQMEERDGTLMTIYGRP